MKFDKRSDVPDQLTVFNPTPRGASLVVAVILDGACFSFISLLPRPPLVPFWWAPIFAVVHRYKSNSFFVRGGFFSGGPQSWD
jgi:hypothetical protein